MNKDKYTLIKILNIIIKEIEDGKIRICEKINNKWITNEWIKQAIFLYFLINNNILLKNDLQNYFDKIPLRFQNFTLERFKKMGIRVVPNAIIRRGSFIGKNTIIMPSYINIGSYVGYNSMIDTWATIGSCAQIGNNVHISGGSGIGGVLEPIQNNPTIIEDNCFIGARSEIVEGVIIGKGSVISMGVFIGKSTKIYDIHNKSITYGYVPPGSVVIPGSLSSSKDKNCMINAAIIIKKVDNKTKSKIQINSLNGNCNIT